MPPKAPSPLAAWAVLSLPLLALLAGLFLWLGGEDAMAAHFALWRAANPGPAQALRLYTDWGNPALYLVFAAMLWLGLKRKNAELTARVLAYLAAQLLFSLALERLFKIALGRPRPGVGGPFVPWSLDGAHNSLPSGHSGEMTLQTSCLLPGSHSLLRPLVLGLALALMGFSRIALGWHHPTDVLAGWLFGSLGGVFARALACRLAPRLARKLARPSSGPQTKGAAS